MAGADTTQPRSTKQQRTVFSVGDLVAENYQILAHVGSGGMGVVYRARDVKLERTVALKFLPSEVNASNREKQLLLKEARLAAALDPPNIGAIYGIETTDDGRTFIIMAFYEGPSLGARIRSDLPLKPTESIDIAKQMARQSLLSRRSLESQSEIRDHRLEALWRSLDSFVQGLAEALVVAARSWSMRVILLRRRVMNRQQSQAEQHALWLRLTLLHLLPR